MHANGILMPVELLENDVVGVARPFHERDVMIARVAGYVEPRVSPPAGRNDADPARGVRLADLGVLEGVIRG